MMPKVISSVFGITMAMILALIQPTVHAAGACKGLDITSCTADPSCRWIHGYKFKTGERVEGYCKVKPGMNAPAYTTGRQDIKRKNADIKPSETNADESGVEKNNIKSGKRKEYEVEHHRGHEGIHNSEHE